MHNGQIGGYDTFRRDADMLIPDALYPQRLLQITEKHCLGTCTQH